MADLLLPFCDAGSLCIRQGAVRKRVVAGLVFVDVEVPNSLPQLPRSVTFA